jgi:hypothetical protein
MCRIYRSDFHRTGEQFPSRIKYFHYGVVSVGIGKDWLSKQGWEELARLVLPLVSALPKIEKCTLHTVECKIGAGPALLVQPYDYLPLS